MIKVLLLDFSHVVVVPINKTYKEGLNELYTKKSREPSFKFKNHFKLNRNLLNYLDTIKDKYELCIFTFGTIHEAPEIAPIVRKYFKKVFSEAQTGYSKEDSTSYTKIAKDLGKKPEEILFTDDREKNTMPAKKAGLTVIHFKSTKGFIKEFKKIV